MRDATVRLLPTRGSWIALGSEDARGIVPEQIVLSSDEHGPSTCAFNLRRSPQAPNFPDLAAFTPCEVEIGGMVVWEGRVRETPSASGGGDEVISVSGEGWQAHLDDDQFAAFYVRQRLDGWTETRSLLPADLSIYASGWTTSIDGTALLMQLPNTNVVGPNSVTGVSLDLGPGNAAKRLVVKVSAGNGASVLGMRVYGGDTAAAHAEGPFAIYGSGAGPGAGVTTTYTVTFSTPRRWVEVQLYNTTGSNVTSSGETDWVRVSVANTYAATAYDDGSAGSALTASTAIKSAIASAAPLLSTDTSLVQSTVFTIPELSLGWATPRQVIDGVNSFHAYQWRITPGRRLEFRPQPAAPILTAGIGSELDNASLGNGDVLYNKVIVEGTVADGTQTAVTRTQTVSALSAARTMRLQLSNITTSTAANAIGDAFLSQHKTTPLKGKLRVTSPAGVRVTLGGASVHPSQLLLNTRELIRLADRYDPDTGAIGRDARIAAVRYDHDSQSAEVDLDDQRSNFEALLARFDAISAATIR